MELSSLMIFNTMHLTLQQPSMVWLMAGNSSFECAKSIVVGKMISGRYRTDYLCRHWTPSNREGFCLADSCIDVKGDLAHMLFLCPSLSFQRERLFKFWIDKSMCLPDLLHIMKQIVSSPLPVKMCFVLDPSLIPAVNVLCATHGITVLTHVYYLARTFAYYMHRAKLISLGRWPGDHGKKRNAKSGHKSPKILTKVAMNNLDNIFSVSGPYRDPASQLVLTSSSSVPSPCQQYQHMTVSVADNSLCNVPTNSTLAPGYCTYAGAVSTAPLVAFQTDPRNTNHTLQYLTLSDKYQYQDCIGGFRGSCGSYDRLAQSSS